MRAQVSVCVRSGAVTSQEVADTIVAYHDAGTSTHVHHDPTKTQGPYVWRLNSSVFALADDMILSKAVQKLVGMIDMPALQRLKQRDQSLVTELVICCEAESGTSGYWVLDGITLRYVAQYIDDLGVYDCVWRPSASDHQ